MPKPTPTLRGRRLGSQLRHLRMGRDLLMQDVAEQLGERGKWSETKVSRIENGLVKLHISDLNALMDLYQVDENLRGELVRLCRMSTQRGTWLSSFEDIMNAEYSQYLHLEREANSIFVFGNIIPGLLQTRYYAHALMEPAFGSDKELIERRVELRMMRKPLLEGDDPLRLWSVMDEAAIRRMVGGPVVMKNQLENLLETSECQNINFQIIPFDVGAYPSSGVSFSILDFDDYLLPSVLYLEHSSYTIYEEDEKALQNFRLRADLIRATALSVSESQAFVRSALKEM